MSHIVSENETSNQSAQSETAKENCDTKHIGRVDNALIETILGEMKSEFNREVIEIETGKKEKILRSSKSVTSDTESVKAELAGNTVSGEDKGCSNQKQDVEDCKEQLIISSDQDKAEEVGRIVNEASEEGVIAHDDGKSTILVTIVADEEQTEVQKNPKCKNTHQEVVADDSWTFIKTEATTGDGSASNDQSSSQAQGKRSLRSQTRTPAPEEEPPGVKRSARRRSKDSPRESVLQSAIARKEKSFSNLAGQSEFDKSASSRNAKAVHRSPRLSPVQPPVKTLSKSLPTRPHLSTPKSPRLAQLQAAAAATTVTSTESTNKPAKEASKSVALPELENPLKTENVVKVATKPHSHVSVTSAHSYTKTGKRKYKPFRGLRYSFTGNPIKRSRFVRRPPKEPGNGSPAVSETSEKKEEEVMEQNDALVGEEKQLFDDSKDVVEFPPTEIQGSRSASPVVAEACQTVQQKRKLQPEQQDSDDDAAKRSRHGNVPSPSPADSSQGPAKPESTAISSGAGTAALCCCQSRSQLYASKTGIHELYCQAVQSIDGKRVGCCNSVTTENTVLLRASRSVPYLIFCDVHVNLLKRHTCCPTCGIFCTQGKFVECSSQHWYHRECELVVDSSHLCPHCGLDSPVIEKTLEAKPAKTPVFLPQQKPVKTTPSAKMSFGGSHNDVVTEKTEERVPVLPLLPPELEIPEIPTSDTLTNLEKDKLDHLLSVACSMHKPGTTLPRYSLKSLYQAAKTGNAEKLVHALGCGLNPNHVFRECALGTAMHAACAGGHLAVVHILLQAGAQMDVLDRDQNTPLMLAAQAKHNEIVKYMVKAGADVTLKGGDGMTALHLAAKCGNLEGCHHLLSVSNVSRMYIDSVDDGGWTPLVWAAEHCHVDVARYLLKHRADPLILDAEQNTALHWSAFSGSIDVTEMMLNYGCDVNSPNVHGDTPLHIGARQDMYNCVLLLLARGAQVDTVNKAGDRPLDCCIPSSESYNAINFNIQLKSVKPRTRTIRILCNDISKGQEQNPIQCVNGKDEEDEPMDFVYVSQNCFTSNISMDRTITSLQSCRCVDTCTSNECNCATISMRCWYDDQGRLLPEFNYAEPPMIFECNQACKCNRITCHNRVMQHGTVLRFQLFRTRDKGWGVRTLRAIPKGTYVCEYIGEIISDCEADHREDDSYLFDLDNKDGETYCIDARHYGNIARFINHMCVPNLVPVRTFIEHQDLRFPRIAFFSNRDIEADEELGFDYGEKFWIIKCKSFTCTCGAETCRYSETTIRQTLDNYNKRLQQDEQQQQQQQQKQQQQQQQLMLS